jgi:hypothetical protein
MGSTAAGRTHKRMLGLKLYVPLVNPKIASRPLEISNITATLRSRKIACITEGNGIKLPGGRCTKPIANFAASNTAAVRAIASMGLNESRNFTLYLRCR